MNGQRESESGRESNRERERERNDFFMHVIIARIFCAKFAKKNLFQLFWTLVMVGGIVMAGFVIRSSFISWQDNPMITSVMQKSIEEIPFPAITICPMDETRLVKIK